MKILAGHTKENQPKMVKVILNLPFSFIQIIGGKEFYIDTYISGTVSYSMN
jgi:hypothetical protein